MDVYGYEDNLMDSTCLQGTVQGGGGSVMTFPLTTKIPRNEHIWDVLQRAVQKRSPSPLTPTHLWTALQDSWCQLPPALL
ncbi:hypothetical protein TNCV_21961 [Trichonephila clavipes]|nr:hypothetical protein TNCV_21961 [Trichonephila clavipes]